MDMKLTWHALNLGDSLLAAPEIDRITQLFLSQRSRESDLQSQALFIRHESEGRLHCEVVIYFPPACSELARQLAAAVCAPPAKQDLGLLAGEDGAWSACFPDQSPGAP
jgi:hypothetical protein